MLENHVDNVQEDSYLIQELIATLANLDTNQIFKVVIYVDVPGVQEDNIHQTENTVYLVQKLNMLHLVQINVSIALVDTKRMELKVDVIHVT